MAFQFPKGFFWGTAISAHQVEENYPGSYRPVCRLYRRRGLDPCRYRKGRQGALGKNHCPGLSHAFPAPQTHRGQGFDPEGGQDNRPLRAEQTAIYPPRAGRIASHNAGRPVQGGGEGRRGCFTNLQTNHRDRGRNKTSLHSRDLKPHYESKRTWSEVFTKSEDVFEKPR
jgi:hypothetical protein